MTKKKRWIVIFLAPGLLLFVFVFLISIVQLGITSFTDWTIGTSPTFAGLKNYIYLFTEDEDFRKVIVNTIIWIVLQSTIHVCIGTTLALILRRKKWYTNLMRGVFMIPNIISSAALGMPTTLYIMMSYYKTISPTLEEAAYIDGAGFFRTFVQIILPLTRPAFATAGVLQFLLCWNEFQFALTLTTGTEKRTLPIALYYFKSAFASDYGAMFAATVLVTVPSIIVYMLMQKQVISGLAAGSVKE